MIIKQRLFDFYTLRASIFLGKLLKMCLRCPRTQNSGIDIDAYNLWVFDVSQESDTVNAASDPWVSVNDALEVI